MSVVGLDDDYKEDTITIETKNGYRFTLTKSECVTSRLLMACFEEPSDDVIPLDVHSTGMKETITFMKMVNDKSRFWKAVQTRLKNRQSYDKDAKLTDVISRPYHRRGNSKLKDMCDVKLLKPFKIGKRKANLAEMKNWLCIANHLMNDMMTHVVLALYVYEWNRMSEKPAAPKKKKTVSPVWKSAGLEPMEDPYAELVDELTDKEIKKMLKFD